MGEERMSLQLFNHGNDTVVPTHPEVVPLADIVGQHNAAIGPDP
jgi:hypothetical protein